MLYDFYDVPNANDCHPNSFVLKECNYNASYIHGNNNGGIKQQPSAA